MTADTRKPEACWEMESMDFRRLAWAFTWLHCIFMAAACGKLSKDHYCRLQGGKFWLRGEMICRTKVWHLGRVTWIFFTLRIRISFMDQQRKKLTYNTDTDLPKSWPTWSYSGMLPTSVLGQAAMGIYILA